MINRRVRQVHTNPGCRYKEVLSPRIGEDGQIELVSTGKEDLQLWYNVQSEETDIKTIIRRVQEGDSSALNRYTPFYGDFTKSPKSLAEFLQIEADCRTMFDGLPEELRKKYDFNVLNFIGSAGSKEWLDDCMPYFSEEAQKFYHPAVQPDQKEGDIE